MHYLCRQKYYKCITNYGNNDYQKAIEEVMSGKNPQQTYSDIDEMFNDILNEEE